MVELDKNHTGVIEYAEFEAFIISEYASAKLSNTELSDAGAPATTLTSD